MLDRNLATKIQHAVDTQFDEQIAFTGELVKFPSVRDAEQTAQDFTAKSLRDRGYAVDIWAMHVDELNHLPGFSPITVSYDNALNVVGSHRPKTKQGAFADSERPYRRGAGRAIEYVDHAALCSARGKWLALWSRQRRYEGRHRGEYLRHRGIKALWLRARSGASMSASSWIPCGV